MTSLRYSALFILAVAVAACAGPTAEKYNANLDRLVGHSMDDVVTAWGPPQSSFKMDDGRTVLEYLRTEGVGASGNSTSLGLGSFSRGPSFGTGIGIGIPLGSPTYEYQSCRTRFIFSQDRTVESWNHEGNNCVSS